MDDLIAQMRRMQDDMDHVMMRSFGSVPIRPTHQHLALTEPYSTQLAMPSAEFHRPSMDVVDLGDKFQVQADLPGMQKEDVKIEVKDGVLKVNAEHKEDVKRNEGNWVVQERKFGKFQRAIRLPENVNQDNIKASFNQGVLHVELPKQDTAPAGRAIKVD